MKICKATITIHWVSESLTINSYSFMSYTTNYDNDISYAFSSTDGFKIECVNYNIDTGIGEYDYYIDMDYDKYKPDEISSKMAFVIRKEIKNLERDKKITSILEKT